MPGRYEVMLFFGGNINIEMCRVASNLELGSIMCCCYVNLFYFLGE